MQTERILNKFYKASLNVVECSFTIDELIEKGFIVKEPDDFKSLGIIIPGTYCGEELSLKWLGLPSETKCALIETYTIIPYGEDEDKVKEHLVRIYISSSSQFEAVLNKLYEVDEHLKLVNDIDEEEYIEACERYQDAINRFSKKYDKSNCLPF